MTIAEIEARQDELYRIKDYLAHHDPAAYLQYCHDREAQLDKLRPGDGK